MEEKTVLTEEETKIVDAFEKAKKLYEWSKSAWIQLEELIKRMDPRLAKVKAMAAIYRLEDLRTIFQQIENYIEINKVAWQPRTDN